MNKDINFEDFLQKSIDELDNFLAPYEKLMHQMDNKYIYVVNYNYFDEQSVYYAFDNFEKAVLKFVDLSNSYEIDVYNKETGKYEFTIEYDEEFKYEDYVIELINKNIK